MNTDQTFSIWTFLRPTIELFTTVTGLFLVIAAIALICVIRIGRIRWIVLGFAGYTSSLVFHYRDWFTTKFIPPVQQLVENGRPLTVTLLVILLIPTFMTAGQASWKTLVRYGPVFYLVFQMFFSVRLAFAGLTNRAITGSLIYSLLFLVLFFGASRWMRTHRDITNAAWTLAISGICFCIVTTVHVMLVPRQIIWQNRLISTSGTSTLASELIAVTILPICFFVAQPILAKATRVLLGLVAGLLVVFLVWTGTRTGVLMAVIGLLMLFRLKLGRLFVAGIVVTGFVWVVLQFFGDALIGADRLFSTLDTRSGTWALAKAQFLDNPIIGVVEGDTQAVENSYLSIAARTGIIGVVFFTLVVGQILAGLIALHRARPRLGEHVMLADLATAGIVSLGLGAVLEGYLLGTISIQLFALFLYLNMMCTLLDPTKADELTLGAVPADEYCGDPSMFAAGHSYY